MKDLKQNMVCEARLEFGGGLFWGGIVRGKNVREKFC